MLIESTRDPQIQQINEMLVDVFPSLPNKVEKSIYYAKLKNLLFPEIFYFCKEKVELKQDLNILRLAIGDFISDKFVIEYLDDLKAKYNGTYENIGIEYNIEYTKYDFSTAVFVIIKRNSGIFAKKFVFRFRNQKGVTGNNPEEISQGGVPLSKDNPLFLDKIKKESKEEIEKKEEIDKVFRKGIGDLND